MQKQNDLFGGVPDAPENPTLGELRETQLDGIMLS